MQNWSDLKNKNNVNENGVIKSISQIRVKYEHERDRSPPPAPARTTSPVMRGDGDATATGSDMFWALNDPNTLPRFSKQAKIDRNFNEYQNILNSEIPQHLKIKLLQYFRQKYENSIKTPPHPEGTDKESGLSPEEQKIVLERTLLTFTAIKQDDARNMLVRLTEQKKSLLGGT